MLRSAQILLLMTSVLSVCQSTNSVVAQSGNRADTGQPAQNRATQISPELAQLLTNWSRASDQVKTLHGPLTRRVYDSSFGVEKISQGKVWFQAPDKGRIDIEPVKITQTMLAERQAPEAKVQRTAEGVPFKLTSDLQAKWVCNGQRVFDVNEEEKTAQVANLPPTLRGKDIMNSPLPFLFGMPPQQAVKRFDLEITKDYRPSHPYVILKALPLQRQDAANWSKAEIYLNTSTYLPTSVKLLDPTGNMSTVYSFTKMQVNRNEVFQRLLGQKPFDPDLRRYTVQVIEQGQSKVANTGQPAGPAVIPNVIGRSHEEAKKLLMHAGVPEKMISLQRGGPARNAADTYKVRDQNPKAGTQVNAVLKAQKKVALLIFEKPL